MAQLITVFGAMLGFVAAVVGFFAYDISFLSAFSIWAVSGPVAAVAGFVIAGTNTTETPASRHSTFDAAA